MIRCVAFAVLVLAVVSTAEEKTTDVEVQGTRGGSIHLAPMIPEGFNTRDVYWRHLSMGEQLVASVSRGFPETAYQSRFLGRAHLHRGFTLEIRDLEIGDTGVFTCMLVSLEGHMSSVKYHVIVYEAVVQPTVQVFVSGGPKECSVFVRCNSSMGNNVSYTWRVNTRQGDPVNTSYTLYDEGRLLITTLRPEDGGASYTCTVANPVSQESVTVVPWESCVSLSEAVAPATMHVFVSGGPDECSIFLRCNSMTGNNVSYTWSANTRQGNPVNTSYSLYDEGRLLIAIIRPEHMEASYTCTVASHVSQQNITVVPWESCLSLPGTPPKTQSYQQILCMASAIALAFVSLMMCVLLLVKTSGKTKTAKNGNVEAAQATNENEEDALQQNPGCMQRLQYEENAEQQGEDVAEQQCLKDAEQQCQEDAEQQCQEDAEQQCQEDATRQCQVDATWQCQEDATRECQEDAELLCEDPEHHHIQEMRDGSSEKQNCSDEASLPWPSSIPPLALPGYSKCSCQTSLPYPTLCLCCSSL